MARITLLLESRRVNSRGLHPVLFRLTRNSSNTTMKTGVFVKPEHWIGEIGHAVKSHCPNSRRINDDIRTLYFKYYNALRDLEISGSLRKLSAAEIKRRILSPQHLKTMASLIEYFESYANTRRADNSRLASLQTLKSILEFSRDVDFYDVDVKWLRAFDNHLIAKGNSINTRSLHFRNIRAVFNSAINEDLIGQELYPFRKFKIVSSRKSKECLTLSQLRAIIDYSPCQKRLQLARDMFMLSFFLCGINMVDLYKLEEIKNGRIQFVRQKTAGKNEDVVSLAIPEEAMQIIERYRGTISLLRFSEEYACYETFYNRMQKSVRKMGEQLGIDNLTFYWARYTWATIADKLGVSEKEISKGLGHVDKSIAGRFYISYDWTKVDRANRIVIDYCKIENTSLSCKKFVNL